MGDEKHDLLDLSDFAWQRLMNRLDGLDDAESLWEPAKNCWSVRRGPDGIWRMDHASPPPEPAPVTTLAWRLAHIAGGVLGAERNATWLGLTMRGGPPAEGDAATAAEALTRLGDAYSFWRECLDAAGDLSEPVGPVGGRCADQTRRAFVLHELDELIHHGGEVGVLRDLYRGGDVSGDPGHVSRSEH